MEGRSGGREKELKKKNAQGMRTVACCALVQAERGRRALLLMFSFLLKKNHVQKRNTTPPHSRRSNEYRGGYHQYITISCIFSPVPRLYPHPLSLFFFLASKKFSSCIRSCSNRQRGWNFCKLNQHWTFSRALFGLSGISARSWFSKSLER